MIKNVLFDLDDTILDFKKSEKAALEKTLEIMGITSDSTVIKRYSDINKSLWEQLELGLIKREVLLVKRFQILFDEIGVKMSAEQAWMLYENLLSEQCFFIEGALELLETLKSNYNLYLVSNGTTIVQDKRIKIANISKYFNQIFISQKIGYNKPKVEFFNSVFESIPQLIKDETIIVGDSLTSDIKGGINAGIHTCWFNRNDAQNELDIKPEYIISKLEQLPEILKFLC